MPPLQTGILMPRGTPYVGLFMRTIGSTLLSGIPLDERQRDVLLRILGVQEVREIRPFGTPYPGAFILPLGVSRVAIHVGIQRDVHASLADVFTLLPVHAPETALGNAVAIVNVYAIVHATASSMLKDFLREQGLTLIEITTPFIDAPGAHILAHHGRLFMSPLIPERVQAFLARETGLTPVSLTIRGDHAIARLMLTGKGIILPEGVQTEELFLLMGE